MGNTASTIESASVYPDDEPRSRSQSQSKKSSKTLQYKYVCAGDIFAIIFKYSSLFDRSTNSMVKEIDTYLCSDKFVKNVVPIRNCLLNRIVDEENNTYTIYIRAESTITEYMKNKLMKDISKNISFQIEKDFLTWKRSSVKVTYIDPNKKTLQFI